MAGSQLRCAVDSETNTKTEPETDTETVALMTERYMNEGLSPVAAAWKTLDRLEGAFALAFLFDGEEDLIVAARKGSPLAIGHGEGEMFVGSDAIALAPLTDRITYLEEGDRAVLTRTSLEIRDAQTLESVASLDAGFGARPLALDPRRGLALTGSVYDGSVRVFDLRARRPLGRVALGGYIKGIAVDSSRGAAWVGSICGLHRIDLEGWRAE